MSFVSRKNDSNCRTRERWGGSFVSRKTVEPGRGGEGSSVSRNTDSNCRTREKEGGGSFVSRNYNSIPSAQGEGEERGHVVIERVQFIYDTYQKRKL